MIIEEDDYLEHYGIKGMRWGQRNARTPGVSRRTDREAAKDAKEFARAKQFYGEGAGTRRKLIKNSVEAKSKRDSSYKKAFDKHLSEQDASKHVEKAKKERRVTDRRTKRKQRLGAIARKATGEMGTQAAFVAVALGGAAFARSPRGRAMMNTAVKTVNNKFTDVMNERKRRKGAAYLNDYFKRNS